ncbi:MAG: hypothetical protein H7239_12370 [Flavobacterium sp.]|nr:hypothetical protein [Flavobacterium sp.]
MITSVFKKSTPINYSILVFLILVVFTLCQFQGAKWTVSVLEVSKKIGLFSIILGSFFLVNFISKKNGLTRDSGYPALFYFLFLLLFPKNWMDYNVVLANFFILLALRRLVSLQTLKAPKEKIFDASLWILAASFFNFWCVLLLFIVYLSIVFHVSRDYRNWLLPFVAVFTATILFVLYTLLFDKKAIGSYYDSSFINLKLDYFKNSYQNLSLSIFAVFSVFFVIPMVFSITNRPLNLQASYKKIFFCFLIGLIIFFISTNKSNQILIFTFFPMCIFATNTIEYSQSKLQQEIILTITILLSFTSFFLQL